MRPVAASGLLPLLLLSGCPKNPMPDGGCVSTVLGDGGAAMQIELIQIGGDQKVRTIAGCDSLDVVEPVQGGRVVFVGFRATNLQGCGPVKLEAALRDPASGGILGAEIRKVLVVAMPDRPGWAATSASGGDLSNVGYTDFANIAVCPNVGPHDVSRSAARLEVKLTDADGRVGTAQATVMPRCADADPGRNSECECLCQAGYVEDKCLGRSEFGHWFGWDGVGLPTDAGACVTGG